ncbi:DUF6683 family protein [Sphingomonas sanxanigenens]|uniref:Uncharacterized protein n=1 Tax=Sphingomonas sanxanigenens DSM 19645 = NX02 TaxID=1123269 RepID=W0AGQ7_9SPHN|nr:DUF6683 family protein [Sphingomonas sanxanigenens]AHE54835.1 hypothetical protein NX02_15775 [Sphingomonas sanxanigenens DSM 19645 = NX02]
MLASARAALTAAACLTFVAAPPAFAQDIGPALDPGLMVGYAGGEAVRYSNERRSSARPVARPRAPLRSLDVSSFTAQSARGAPGGRAEIDTSYTPDPARTQKNLRQFVQRTREADEKTGADLERSLRGGKLLNDARAAFAQFGLDGNDVADTVAGYLVTAWYTSRGRGDDPSKAQLRAVSNQIASAMAASPEFAEATEDMKQELAEAMMIHTIYAGAAIEQVKNDPEMLERVSDAIAKGAQSTFGFDVRTMGLDENGLSLGRTGARDDAKGADKQALALAGDAGKAPAEQEGGDASIVTPVVAALVAAGVGGMIAWKARGRQERG